MEKVTLTKLYEVLAQKVGKNEAECLTQYIEIKVKDELNTKTEILATKQDIFVLKENIHELRSELKEEIHGLRSEVKEEIHSLRSEVKAEIHGLRTEMKGEISGLRTEMKEHSLSQQKWMLTIFIALVTMFITTILLKH